ncbi:SRPBCC family protein [Oerskovia jenensis]|uniref:SRPBCC family protein n=1 Tax=Oerskovia jenensis TaxID=162169 RepID=UPI0036DF69C6
MTFDLRTEIDKARRTVGERDDARVVLLSRTYDAPVEDVWDACTDAERIARWFLPVTGELRLGGRYQLQGNAGGEVRECEPPRRFLVTWGMSEEDRSTVELRLAPADDGATELTLEHVAVVPPEFWDQFGPGAVGVGWDLALVGLAAHVAGVDLGDPATLETSPEMRALQTASAQLWRGAHEASGAGPAAAEAAAAATTAFYVPPLEGGATPAG